MNNKVAADVRIVFRDWLRGELRRLEFYQRRGDHYLIREFIKYAVGDRQTPIDEASMGRYLRDADPVLPTPERCRALARVLDIPPLAILAQAGYVSPADFGLPAEMRPADLADTLKHAIEFYYADPLERE